jgi:hypothetical protein
MILTQSADDPLLPDGWRNHMTVTREVTVMWRYPIASFNFLASRPKWAV